MTYQVLATNMDLHMSPERGLHSKLLLTNITAVGSLSCVRPDVSNQVRWLPEARITLVTLVGVKLLPQGVTAILLDLRALGLDLLQGGGQQHLLRLSLGQLQRSVSQGPGLLIRQLEVGAGPLPMTTVRLTPVLCLQCNKIS